MPGKNKMPLLGWHPRSAGLEAWIRAEAQRRGGGRGSLSAVLEDGMTAYRATIEAGETPPAVTRAVTAPVRAKPRKQAAQSAPVSQECPPHPKSHVHWGLCGACGRSVGTEEVT